MQRRRRNACRDFESALRYTLGGKRRARAVMHRRLSVDQFTVVTEEGIVNLCGKVEFVALRDAGACEVTRTDFHVPLRLPVATVMCNSRPEL
jgi:hypothetical protein